MGSLAQSDTIVEQQYEHSGVWPDLDLAPGAMIKALLPRGGAQASKGLAGEARGVLSVPAGMRAVFLQVRRGGGDLFNCCNNHFCSRMGRAEGLRWRLCCVPVLEVEVC